MSWYACNIHPDCETRRKLRTWIVGKGQPEEGAEEPAAKATPDALSHHIDDVASFHASANVLPPKYDPMAHIL